MLEEVEINKSINLKANRGPATCSLPSQTVNNNRLRTDDDILLQATAQGKLLISRPAPAITYRGWTMKLKGRVTKGLALAAQPCTDPVELPTNSFGGNRRVEVHI